MTEMFKHNYTIVVVDITLCLALLRKRMIRYIPYDIIAVAAEVMLSDDLGYIVHNSYLNKRNYVDMYNGEISSLIKELKDNLYEDIIDYLPKLSNNDEANVLVDENYMEIRISNGSSNSIKS